MNFYFGTPKDTYITFVQLEIHVHAWFIGMECKHPSIYFVTTNTRPMCRSRILLEPDRKTIGKLSSDAHRTITLRIDSKAQQDRVYIVLVRLKIWIMPRLERFVLLG